MARSSNPIFNAPAFSENTRAINNPGAQQQGGSYSTSTTPPPAAGVAQGASAGAFAQNAAVQANLEGVYSAPSAGALETDRMTVEDTIWKTVGLFAIMLAVAVGTWVVSFNAFFASGGRPGVALTTWIVGALGGFVLAMVVSFTSRKRVLTPVIFAYAAFEGLFIGGISAYFEMVWPGIVMQATLATVAVVGVTLALFASGKVRASAKATKIFMIAMVGYLVFSLLNVVLMLTGVLPQGSMFGLHSMPIAGIPLGLIIGIFVVLLAAYSLVLDFDRIQQGVKNGAPRKFGWVGAFGIMVTVVWLYVEILRILAILRGNN